MVALGEHSARSVCPGIWRCRCLGGLPPMVIICSFVHRLWWGTPPDPVPTLSTSLHASCPQSPQASCQENLPLFSLMLSPGGSPHIESRRAPPILSPGRFLSLHSVDILGSGIPCSGSCPMCCGIFSSITYLSQVNTSFTFPYCYNGRCGQCPQTSPCPERSVPEPWLLLFC